MAIQVTPLPYSTNALEPVISERALKIHYYEHYRTYIEKLNDLVSDTIYEDLSLKDIVLRSGKKNQWDHETKIFNNADQAWNHSFFWNCLTPARNMRPSEHLVKKINDSFGSLDVFIEQFTLTANELFGSGWLWLVISTADRLEIISGKNDENPLASGYTPLFVIDLWEHAYYMDYQSNRADYIQSLWQIVNWSFVHAELVKAEKYVQKKRTAKNAFQNLPFYFRQKWIG